MSTGLTNDSACPFQASEDQMILQTSWLLRFNIIYCTLLSAGCFIGILYCIKYMRKHPIFNESTIILLYLSLTFAVIHDVAHVFLQWALMYRSFYYADDPCNIFFDSDDCMVFGRPLLFGISGLIYIHSALSIDGLLATFIPDIYYRYHRIPGLALAVATVVFTGYIQVLVLPFGETGKDYLPSCQFFTKQAAARANVFLLSSLVLTAINLIINLTLLYINKLHSKRTRFDVQFQYQKSEAMMTSKSISVLVIAQISALGIYAGGSWMFRMVKDQIPVYLYNNLVIWVYALSYATVSLPLLIVFCIKYVRRRRQRTIHNITTHRESQQNRMDELKALWG
ncbi:unnamed protein product [Caenorhabditis sp. 36 PRJEB53466]|nr:unnamed protein product [Caenorhabditis sp. 36 PRJEB53466]